jgi:hypothetical protein
MRPEELENAVARALAVRHFNPPDEQERKADLALARHILLKTGIWTALDEHQAAAKRIRANNKGLRQSNIDLLAERDLLQRSADQANEHCIALVREREQARVRFDQAEEAIHAADQLLYDEAPLEGTRVLMALEILRAYIDSAPIPVPDEKEQNEAN